MKIIRHKLADGSVQYGSLQADGTARRIEGDIFADFRVTGESVALGKLLAPVVPTSLVCIGLNYRRHAEEGNLPAPEFPVIFMKLPAVVQNPGDPIQLPRRLKSTEVDYECELALVIGKTARNVTRADALDHVLGYTCANDVSARDWQMKWGGGQWCRGKTFDTFAPLGPCLVLRDEIPDPNKLRIKTILNGKVMQDWNTDDMIFDIPTLIEFLTADTTLRPGTVILTGTPHGIGAARKPPVFLKDGDVVSIEIEKIGTLTNPVIG
jgi:2-keto-4-pentenoate hydratase/2-oxohepta-3-ene-1,7-dioic acid hydratase in catechol pathway